LTAALAQNCFERAAFALIASARRTAPRLGPKRDPIATAH
jgi:hypothetical protein